MLPQSLRFAAPVVLACLVTADTGAWHAVSAGAETKDDKLIVHVLNRIGFGPRPGDVQRVRELGVEAYIEQQLRPERIADDAVAARLEALPTARMDTRELVSSYFGPADAARREARRKAAEQTPSDPGVMPPEPKPQPVVREAALARTVITELQQQKLLRAIYSSRQLEEVMVDFWFNHFNVFAGKGQTRLYLTSYERDTIRPLAFGSFRELLGAVASSPAMLFYLDNWRSAAPGDARPGARRPSNRSRGINENYARELLELHTLGVDGGYTQKDVQEVARAFTGWTIAQPRQGGGFVFNPRLHDNGSKTVLGVRLAPGGGQRDGERVLDMLASHPSTALFIATKLARRFIADDPPPAVVKRVAARFLATKGDIREVLRTLLLSKEFLTTSAYRAKVKTPFEFVVSAVRAVEADAVSAMPLVQATRQLGMPLYLCQPPTGYSERAEAWVNTGALLNRMNFALALSTGQLRAVRPSFGGHPSRQQRAVPDAAQVREALVGVMAGDVSASTRMTVEKATEPSQAAALLLGSPEFQKR